MIIYSLHVALLLAIWLVFYKLFLQKETYYKLNRLMLLSCLILAFVLPLIHVPAKFSLRGGAPTATEILIENNTDALLGDVDTQELTTVQESLNSPTAIYPVTTAEVPLADKALKWAFWVYWCGVAILGANLLLQLIVLFLQGYRKPVIKDGIFRIVELDSDKAPCSFGNTIFINPAKYDWETYNQILTHEKVHIKQGHTFDLMLAEIVLVFQWFNPFAWMYRKELESNLEFLTDDSVLYKHNIELEDYQLSLLKVSVPNLSMNITTNYNQSLLKRRILMMNAKKSNVHIMWKYLMIIPLLFVLVCGLNEPEAKAVDVEMPLTTMESSLPVGIGKSKGLWSGTIIGDKVKMECKSDDDRQNKNYSYVLPGIGTFNLNEFTNLPKTTKSDFAVSREAGTAIFNGKFDDKQGFGKYKFTVHENYKSYMEFKSIRDMDEDDYFAFFIMDIKKSYIQFLNDSGYTRLTKNQILALFKYKVDESYLTFWQSNGVENVTIDQLIALKKLKIDSAYLAEIRKAGYKDITIPQLITFKSQNVTPSYIAGLRRAKSQPKTTTANATEVRAVEEQPTVADLVKSKSMNIDTNFVASLRDIGYPDLSSQTIYNLRVQKISAAFIKSYMDIGMKNLTVNTLYNLRTQNLSADYIKGFYDIGLKDITTGSLYNLRTQGITAAYIKSFYNIGLKDISFNTLYNYKIQGITSDQIKGFMDVGYKNLSLNDLHNLKTNNITPVHIKAFQKLGFYNTTIKELISCKNAGITPEFVAEMKQKGFNSKVLSKYMQLKSFNTGERTDPKNW